MVDSEFDMRTHIHFTDWFLICSLVFLLLWCMLHLTREGGILKPLKIFENKYILHRRPCSQSGEDLAAEGLWPPWECYDFRAWVSSFGY